MTVPVTPRRTPVKAIARLRWLVAQGYPLTPQAHRWLTGWLVGATMRGMPVPYIYGLPVEGDSRAGYTFSDSAVFLEWDLAGRACTSLECGPGDERYLWACADLDREESVDAYVRLDGPTTTRLLAVLAGLSV